MKSYIFTYGIIFFFEALYFLAVLNFPDNFAGLFSGEFSSFFQEIFQGFFLESFQVFFRAVFGFF